MQNTDNDKPKKPTARKKAAAAGGAAALLAAGAAYFGRSAQDSTPRTQPLTPTPITRIDEPKERAVLTTPKEDVTLTDSDQKKGQREALSMPKYTPGNYASTVSSTPHDQAILLDSYEIKIPVTKLGDIFLKKNPYTDVYTLKENLSFNPQTQEIRGMTDARDPGFKQLIEWGKLSCKALRVTLLPDDSDPFLSKIFSGKSFLIAHEDPVLNKYSNFVCKTILRAYYDCNSRLKTMADLDRYDEFKEIWSTRFLTTLSKFERDATSFAATDVVRNAMDSHELRDKSIGEILRSLNKDNRLGFEAVKYNNIRNDLSALLGRLAQIFDPNIEEPRDDTGRWELMIHDERGSITKHFELGFVAQLADAYSAILDTAIGMSYSVPAPQQAQGR